MKKGTNKSGRKVSIRAAVREAKRKLAALDERAAKASVKPVAPRYHSARAGK